MEEFEELKKGRDKIIPISSHMADTILSLAQNSVAKKATGPGKSVKLHGGMHLKQQHDGSYYLTACSPLKIEQLKKMHVHCMIYYLIVFHKNKSSLMMINKIQCIP